MRNVELFKNNTDVVKSFDFVFGEEFNLMELNLIEYYNNVLESLAFKNIIFDAGVFEFSENFDRNSFENIKTLFDTYVALGSYESIIGVIRAFLGATTSVVFEDNGRTIIISGGGDLTSNIVTPEGDAMITPEGEYILSVDNRLRLQFTQLEYLIRLFLPAGIKYTILAGE